MSSVSSSCTASSKTQKSALVAEITAAREAGLEEEADRLDKALHKKWLKVRDADKELARLRGEEKKVASAFNALLRDGDHEDEEDE